MIFGFFCRFRHVRGPWIIVCQKFRNNIMTFTKSSESPLQNMLKIFVDDQKLKKLCVSTFESAHVFLLAFCHIEPSALRIRFFWSHHSNFFSKAPLKKVKTPTSFFCSRGCNDLNFFSQTMIFFDLKIFQYGESLTTEKISLGHKFRPLFLLLWDELWNLFRSSWFSKSNAPATKIVMTV